MTPTRYEALQDVRTAFASEQAMAEAFEVSQPTVWRWLNQSKQIPAEHALRAERLTGVPRHHLRPDIYPADLGPSPSWHGVDRGAHRVSFNQTNGLQVAQPFDGRTSKATEADGATRAIGEGLAA